MKILTAYCTDAGTVKKVNQDALLIKTAEYEGMEIAFMCVCDGMGGLSMGEYASRQLIYEFANWFDEQFESILEGEDWQHDIMNQWVDLLENVNIELQKYGNENGIKLGTTCTAMLIIDRKYYIIHIGDSRVYEIKNDDNNAYVIRKEDLEKYQINQEKFKITEFEKYVVIENK